MSNVICVYKIISPNGNTYIGSTINLKRRLAEHKKHPGCRRLHFSIEKYGWENHICEVIQHCNIDELRDLESKYKQMFIDEYGWEKALFFQIDDRSCYIAPEDFSEKMRRLALENWKKNPSMGFTGKKHTKKSNIQRVNTKRLNGTDKVSAETRKKISQGNLGKRMSDDTKQKISQSKSGVKLSAEHVAALRAAKRPQNVITCPHCQTSGGNAMHRWHFNNCKNKN
jgi:group I intron endonuclease